MNAKIRSVVFWIHLAVGVTAGIIVLIMSVTGVLLMYEKQITAWADRRGEPSALAAPGATRLPAETLIARVREAQPGATVATMTVRADPNAPVAIGSGRELVYVNPYTGQLLGGGSAQTRAFFQSVTAWHRWLAIQGEGRATARAATGAANLGFLFLVVSGLYLWLPRRWSRPAVKAITVFNARARGKARDFNWHHVFGFWLGIPLLFVVASGVVISYPWAGNLLYRAVGEEPPAPAARPAGAPAQAQANGNAGGAGRGAEGRTAEGRNAEGRSGERRGAEGNGPRGPRPAATAVSLDGLEALVLRAQTKVDGWQSLTVRLPAAANAPVVFTIDRGTAGQPQYRGTLTLDASSGQELRWEPFSSLSPGRQLRTWARFTHTGEYYGLAGQTIAGLASLAGAFLVYTGLALSLRRLLQYLRRRTAAASAASAATRAA
jgi:uncharacterized iron-regulated membrane protein